MSCHYGRAFSALHAKSPGEPPQLEPRGALTMAQPTGGDKSAFFDKISPSAVDIDEEACSTSRYLLIDMRKTADVT